jgi:hypothetical protein
VPASPADLLIESQTPLFINDGRSHSNTAAVLNFGQSSTGTNLDAKKLVKALA